MGCVSGCGVGQLATCCGEGTCILQQLALQLCLWIEPRADWWNPACHVKQYVCSLGPHPTGSFLIINFSAWYSCHARERLRRWVQASRARQLTISGFACGSAKHRAGVALIQQPAAVACRCALPVHAAVNAGPRVLPEHAAVNTGARVLPACRRYNLPPSFCLPPGIDDCLVGQPAAAPCVCLNLAGHHLMGADCLLTSIPGGARPKNFVVKQARGPPAAGPLLLLLLRQPSGGCCHQVAWREAQAARRKGHTVLRTLPSPSSLLHYCLLGWMACLIL